MTVYTYDTILKKAKECKNNVQTHQKGEISHKWSYYIGCALLNPKKDVTKISIAKAPKPSHTSISRQMTKSQYLALAKKLVDFVKKEHRLPNYIYWKGYKISGALYTYTLSRCLVYLDKHGKYDNEIIVDSNVFSPYKYCKNPYTSKPHYTDNGCNKLGQCTPYYCGPHSIHQGLRKFGITNISEAQLAAWAGTTTDGSDHQGLNTAILKASKKAGIKVDITWYNFSDLGKTNAERFKKAGEMICKPNVFGFWHIWYKCSGECNEGQGYGHYEMTDIINTKDKEVRALNSLGSRLGNGYYGHLQWRSFGLQAAFISGISQKSLCIVTKK